jgi:hypothetical protein
MRSSVGLVVECWAVVVAVTFCHNAVRDLLFRIGKEVEVVVTREPPLPVLVVGFESRTWSSRIGMGGGISIY